MLKGCIAYINKWLDFQFKMSRWQGMTAAILWDDRLIYSNAWGVARGNEVLTDRHLFRMASHSKVFTALAVMQLVEQGLLKLDDTLGALIPALLKHSGRPLEQTSRITVLELLRHTSGLFRDGDNTQPFWQLLADFPNNTTMIATTDDDTILSFGGRFKYSNWGYAILGIIIEQLTGLSYQEYVKNNIIARIDTKVLSPGESLAITLDYSSDLPYNVVAGHIDFLGRLKQSAQRPIEVPSNVYTNAFAPAAGACANSRSMCALFRHLFWGDQTLISDESKQILIANPSWVSSLLEDRKCYAAGFLVERDSSYCNSFKVELIGHSGTFPGQRSKTMADFTNKIVVSVAVNNVEADVNYLIMGVYSIIDLFQGLQEEQASSPLQQYEMRLSGLYETMDVVYANGNLYLLQPAINDFAKSRTILRQVGKHTFQVKEDCGFRQVAEPVRFVYYNDGRLHYLAVGSCWFFPIEDYDERYFKWDSLQVI